MSASNIRTFEGSFYKHLGKGTFLFYRSNNSSTEVHVRKWHCGGVSTCACAVAVREGGDVIVADMCHGQYKQSSLRFFIRSMLPLHEDTKIMESSNGRSFSIKLPSGSEIKIEEFYWGISIYLSVTNPGEGLCRGATPSAQKTMTSFFNNFTGHSEPAATVTPQDFCSCSGLESLNQSRQSCQPSRSSPSPDEALDITKKIIDKQPVLLKGFGSNNGLHSKHEDSLQADAPIQSYERSEKICHNILNTSDPQHVCKSVLGSELWRKILQICMDETQEGFDMGLLQASGQTVTTLCKEKIENMKDNQTLLRRWKNELCENRCGQNGHCYQGHCKCDEGYGSVDCSVDLKSAPLTFLQDRLCDVRNEMCDEIFISGSPFLNFGSLSCSFTPVKKRGQKWIEDRHGTFTAKAIFYSRRGVICRIPENRRSRFTKSEEAFHIRVSNNGYLWSKAVLRVGYDSFCKNCSGTESCTTKTGMCSIESRCFINGDVSQKIPCLICSSVDNSDGWTTRSDNLPPFFTSPTEDSITILLGDEISFLVNASDPEGEPLKITHDVPQARIASDGEFRWKPDRETTQTIQLLATDECGRTASKYLDVVVRKCPCRNDGKCVKISKNEFKCVCSEEYEGVYCEKMVSPCAPNPCHHGKCEEIGSDFRCICGHGYHGNLCHLKAPVCHSSPCQRGNCQKSNSTDDGFHCKCPRYYGGRLCEIELSACARDPCVRGQCRSNNDVSSHHSNNTNSFECICPPGFHGKLCSRRTTACRPNPCLRGRCVDLGSMNMRCLCPPSHHGKFCNITGLYCGSTRCINGTCDSNGEKCICRKNYIGERCDTLCNIDCVNGACSLTSRGSVCKCDPGHTGADCGTKIQPCDSNPCGHGICINTKSGHLCHCYPGYSGSSCNTSACSMVDCNNGTCILVSGIPVCRCLTAYTGQFCERRRQPCDTFPCLNGLCIATEANSFTCSCNPGFQGALCGERIDPCLSNPCGDGTCKGNLNGTFSCKCPPGYVDRFCKETLGVKLKTNPCDMNPCVHGQCESVSDTDFRCNCQRSYVGRFCEKRFDICASSPCVHGRCSSVLEGTFSCACDAGFSGALCQIDHRPCSKNPCFAGVRCSNIDDLNFRCADCPSGYVGDGIQCSIVKDETKSVRRPCPRQFCFPGVQCSIVNSQIHCEACPRGYYGNGFYCRVLCELPCKNGGTCVAPGVCRCRRGFIGVTCARAFCRRSCLNGGRCISPGKCRCPLAFYGERCENAKCNVKCLHDGKCIPPGKCRCLPGYTGASCEQAVCPLGCLNGGQCVRPGVCRCSPGYFGTRCQQGTCSPQCRNGGICVRKNVCSCPQGYRGTRCQTAVCQRPCQNGGRCFKKDRCSCVYGYWGDVCQHVHCLRPCLNGGRCIKPNVCLCPTNYAGVTCNFYVG
ncbi:fibropellin-1-like isoform X2 [Dendronephthya gigantea]|uniref:fibropellin-1-like isoform X2 n=1 Tax=Dendronephthya gigantea TaxID=151771 RepID=UPI00106BE84A|nr:fibropellin-1-like isoform X2 [Dendronephthya gigantea]